MVSQPGQRSIPPGSAHRKVEQNIHSTMKTKDTEALRREGES